MIFELGWRQKNPFPIKEYVKNYNNLFIILPSFLSLALKYDVTNTCSGPTESRCPPRLGCIGIRFTRDKWLKPTVHDWPREPNSTATMSLLITASSPRFADVNAWPGPQAISPLGRPFDLPIRSLSLYIYMQISLLLQSAIYNSKTGLQKCLKHRFPMGSVSLALWLENSWLGLSMKELEPLSGEA